MSDPPNPPTPRGRGARRPDDVRRATRRSPAVDEVQGVPVARHPRTASSAPTATYSPSPARTTSRPTRGARNARSTSSAALPRSEIGPPSGTPISWRPQASDNAAISQLRNAQRTPNAQFPRKSLGVRCWAFVGSWALRNCGVVSPATRKLAGQLYPFTVRRELLVRCASAASPPANGPSFRA